TQYTLLAVLARGGEWAQGDLAEALVVDSTTLSRTLAALRRRGLLDARPGADRRVRLYRVTAAGRRALRGAERRWERAQARLRDALGEEEWSALLERLVDVTRAAERA
ncbi:MAG: MarR family winged helix-turn-helix transcriptional regulator, partial [Gemmatimonadota bacterium]